MIENSNLSSYPEKEIDLKEIFKILILSKKLLIFSILIFTITGIVYSLSKKPEYASSVYIEIGHYEIGNGTMNIIESPSDLISKLKTFQISITKDRMLDQEVSIKSIGVNLIKLEYISNSNEQNEIILNRFINFALDHHNFLLNKYMNSLTNNINHKISQISLEISYLETKIAEYKKINNLELIESFEKQNTNYLILENDDRDKLFSLKQNLGSLEHELNNINSQTIQESQVVGDLFTKTLQTSKIPLITLFLITGVFFGLFLVFVNNFIKSLK